MRTILILILVASAAWAQTETYGYKANSATTVDMSAALSSRPVPEKASAPATCVKGEQYFNTTDAKKYSCTATNTWAAFAQVIYTGSQPPGTGALAANTCATAIDITATGVVSTDVVRLSENADWSAITGYGAGSADGLLIYKWPTAGHIFIKVCNGTGTSITPGAATVNVSVTR